MLKDRPQSDIAEITLIGTGGGYGESIIIHLGDSNWAVIDSCRDPFSRKSLPLAYLEQLGVDVANDVKLILCTHWHDDHLLGLSELLKACESAVFCWGEATDRTKFLQFVELDHQKLNKESSNSSTLEFGNCLRIISDRSGGSNRKLAKADTIIFGKNLFNSIRCEIIALSPSDQSILNFHKEISTLIDNYGAQNKKIMKATPNSKSIALFLKLGEHRAILGADLEVSKDPLEGWDNILNCNTVIDKKASLFKIPHHGSSNGYSDRVWIELLETDPVAKLTPWNKNEKLPELDMLKRYCSHSSFIFMTSPVFSPYKPKKRDRSIEKILEMLNCKLSEVNYNQGIIRCRIPLNSKRSIWCTELFENALHIHT
jgi:beta-lactamase superfamily II metal-dependent hydrolase